MTVQRQLSAMFQRRRQRLIERRMRSLRWLLPPAAAQIYAWISLAALPRSGSGAPGVGDVVAIIALLEIAAFVVMFASELSLRYLVGLGVFALSLLLSIASLTYYGIGVANWSVHLSRVSALYVAVGTLTTAGAGDVYARTDLARGLLTTQMALDFLVVTVIVGTILSHIAARPSRGAVGPAGEN